MGEIAVDVVAIARSMENELLNNGSREPERRRREATSFTIHRVPREMRVGADSSDFVPKVFSIGPIHRGKKELLEGENAKWTGLRQLINHDLKNLLEKIIKEVSSSIVTEARKCYEKQIVESLDDEILVQIMLLDGCYIIHAILQLLFSLDDGCMFPAMLATRHDLLLLENQIPFPVLQCLFHSIYPILISDEFFKKYVAEGLKVMAQQFVVWQRPAVSCPIADPVHHLLHLFHSSLRPAPPNSDDNSCWSWFVSLFRAARSPLPHEESARRRPGPPGVPRRALQSATQLLEAGVKFRKSKEAMSSFIDVRFRGGIIEMPRLSIQSSTVSQFRNLLAFEKGNPDCSNHITTYLAFMNSLIDTAKDVDLLISSGVLENKLGSDEDMASFFNTPGTSKTVFLKFKDHYLVGLFKDLEAYCAAPRHRYRAKLERDYLGRPWSVISLIAGTVLLLLTLVQTIIAFYVYFRPPRSLG